MYLRLIFVNYVDYASLSSFLAKAGTMPDGVSVTVVDNTPVDDRDYATLDQWAGLRAVSVVRPDTNLGYMGAFREGLRETRSNADEYAVLCNTDLAFDVVSFVSALRDLEASGELAGVGVLAPALVDESNALLSQRHMRSRPSSKKYRGLARIYALYPLGALQRAASDIRRNLSKEDAIDSFWSEPQIIFAPHGACMVFTPEYLKVPEAVSFSQFLFCEEPFVGLVAERESLKVRYSPELSYSHVGHGSMGKIPTRRLVRMLQRSHEWAAAALSSSEHKENGPSGV